MDILINDDLQTFKKLKNGSIYFQEAILQDALKIVKYLLESGGGVIIKDSTLCRCSLKMAKLLLKYGIVIDCLPMNVIHGREILKYMIRTGVKFNKRKLLKDSVKLLRYDLVSLLNPKKDPKLLKIVQNVYGDVDDKEKTLKALGF